MTDLTDMEKRRQHRRENRMDLALALREKKRIERGDDERKGRETEEELQEAPETVWIPPWEFNPAILTQIKEEDCNSQDNCPLFKKLPGEIREIIYKFVFLQYESKNRAYPKDVPYYRPGSTARKCIDTALLYTCRRVLSEARFIPLQTATHEFWCDTPAPPHATCDNSRDASASGLVIYWHVAYMRHYHINISTLNYFTRGNSSSQRWGGIGFSPQDYRPRTLTVCIGFTGWTLWNWGNEPELKYLNFFKYPMRESIEQFTLRLETMEIFAEDLDDIVKYLKEQTIRLQDDKAHGWALSAEEIPLKVTKWTGPHAKYLSRAWAGDIQHLGPDPMQQEEMWYYMVDITWKRAKVDWARTEESGTYHTYPCT
ncbi:hypothetical protein FQN54_009601 [Arachnomyces sp. PD_36]|nr:hypothetical protein FQN54_009601 [Arachnomyces sp. PD_36]